MPKFLANLDLNQNELQNAVVQVLSANPSSPTTGQIYYNSSSNVLRYYDGTAWEDLAAGSGGETNQNAFSIVAVSGQSNVEADAKTDTLNLVAGSNVTITTTPASDSITIAASGDVDSVNTQTGDVVLDADDISDTSTTNKFATSTQLGKIDNITISQAVDLDTLESDVATNNAKVSNVTTNLSTTANGTSLVINSSDGNNASIPAATTTAWGAMTDEDKTKLDGIDTGANNYTHPNHTGDVTSTGDGATTIANNAVTHAKYQQVATDTIIGRTAAGTGNVTALTKAQTLGILNVSDGADVTATALPLISSDVTIGDASDVTVTTSGGLTVTGDLTVNGTTTTVDSTNTNIADALIELGSGNTGANSNDLGLILERGTTGNNGFIGWDESADKFTVGTTTATGASTGSLSITTGTLVANIEGNVTGNVTGDVTGNADTATALATSRSIALSGDVSGSASFDGSANISITATIADDSHNHTISNVDGLQTALDGKQASLTFGIANDNAVEIDDTDVADNDYARFTANGLEGRSFAEVKSDLSLNNVTNESKATMFASAALTGTPTAPSASAATDSTQIATTAFTQDAIDARTYAVSIGDGTNTSYTITHSLGTRDVIIQLYDASSYDTVFADVVRTNTTQATITFASAPTTNDVRVLVTKVV
jgi:hypothetical protein